MTRWLALLLLGAALPLKAQMSPIPSDEDPRMQTVTFEPGQPVRLVAFSDASLKLVFHQGESIERAVISDGDAFRASVVGYGDVIELVALRPTATASMRVETDRRNYLFEIETGEGLAAAFMVRLVPDEDGVVAVAGPDPDAVLTQYRLSGDREVRPDEIYDDGVHTYIYWHPDRTLPAVFGVGPSDDEEMVAGFMRDDIFVIDRIYGELVFRYDNERARARREEERD